MKFERPSYDYWMHREAIPWLGAKDCNMSVQSTLESAIRKDSRQLAFILGLRNRLYNKSKDCRVQSLV